MKKNLICLFALLSISACSNDVKNTLGMNKPSPDEFTVISYPPLSVPPDFSLSEPASALVNQPNYVRSGTKHYSTEESKLLNKISSEDAKSATKLKIDEEYNQKAREARNKGSISKALDNIQGSNEDLVIDPESEKERIDNNIKEGKSISAGEVKNQEQKTTIQRIFGN